MRTIFSKKKRVEWSGKPPAGYRERRAQATGRQMMVALFRPKLPWCFDHGLHHYGPFADCTAPLRRISSESSSRMPDGWVGRSLLASRSTRRSNRARNCSPVSAERLATWRRSHVAFLSETWTPDLASTPNSHVSPYDAAFPGTLPVCDLSSRFCTA